MSTWALHGEHLRTPPISKPSVENGKSSADNALQYARAATLQETIVAIARAAEQAGPASTVKAIQAAAREGQYFASRPDQVPLDSTGWYGFDLDATLAYFDGYVSET